MNDAKPKRSAREPERVEVSPHEPTTPRSTAVVPGAEMPQPIGLEAPAAAEAVSEVREAIEQIAPRNLPASHDPLTDSADDPWAAVAEAQAALARGCAAAAVEMTGMTGSGIAAAGDAAIALFGATTLSEAVEISAGLTLRGIDAVIEASARLSAIGVKVVREVSRPIATVKYNY